MPSHDNSHDTDATRDLLNDAMRTCEHARLTLELVAKQVALAEFSPPTDYQVAGTGRVVAEFSRATITKYLELVRSIDASIVLNSTDINVSYIDNELIAAALARVDEHLITQILRSKADGTLSPLAPIVDSEEAELIFAMLHAANRRVNAQGEPLIVEEDVDYRVLERLIWRIAAEARSVLERGLLELDEIDEILTTAAKRFLGPYRRRNLTSAERVAQRLVIDGANLSMLLHNALGRAQLRLFCAIIATRLGLPYITVQPAITQPERLALLLKALDLTDTETASILLEMSVPLNLADDHLIAIVEGSRSLKGNAPSEMLRQMRLYPAYRAAIFEKERSLKSR